MMLELSLFEVWRERTFILAQKKNAPNVLQVLSWVDVRCELVTCCCRTSSS